MSEHSSEELFSARYLAALMFVAQAHRDEAGHQQHRKGHPTNPYLSHLMAVSTIIWESGGDEDQAIAGLLHDTIEDAGVTEDALAALFGRRVASIVSGCSDGEPGGERSAATWWDRKTKYLSHLRDADYDIKLVSAADKLHNASALASDAAFYGPSFWRNFHATAEQSLWYHRQVVEALEPDLAHGPPGGQRLLWRLGQAVDDLAATVQAVPPGAAGRSSDDTAMGLSS